MNEPCSRAQPVQRRRCLCALCLRSRVGGRLARALARTLAALLAPLDKRVIGGGGGGSSVELDEERAGGRQPTRLRATKCKIEQRDEEAEAD